jgi:hypothetical protein
LLGQDFTESILPAYPTCSSSPVLEIALKGRPVHGGDFNPSSLKVGPFRVLDWFGDGSFYLLDTPGHGIRHMSGLARITIGHGKCLDTFILIGGDVCHYAGELRPVKYLPLPDNLDSSTIGSPSAKSTDCLASVYTSIHSLRSRVKLFYSPAPGVFNHDSEKMSKTLEKAAELDGD